MMFYLDCLYMLIVTIVTGSCDDPVGIKVAAGDLRSPAF